MKKALSLLVIATMLFGLWGCGGTASQNEQKSELTETQIKAQIDALGLDEMQTGELMTAFALGFPMDQVDQETISGKELSQLLDCLVEYAAPELLADWKSMYPALRASKAPLSRFDAMAALYLAVHHIGGDYLVWDNDHAINIASGYDHSWDVDYLTWDLYGGWDAVAFDDGEGPASLDGACYYHNVGRRSPESGEAPFAYDPASNSLRVRDNATYAEALLAIVREIAVAEHMKTYTLSPEVLALSRANPQISAEDHPLWSGFVLSWDRMVDNTASVSAIENVADWGFNSVRILVDYRNLFDEDLSPKVDALERIDSFVSAAIQRGLHLNLDLSTLPGRAVTEDAATFSYVGEFDLFINEEQQQRADQVWRVLAERYRDVSNYNLSFTPFYEPMNKNLSTGLPYPDYTAEDVGRYLLRVTDVIRESSPDRLIIYEPTPGNTVEDILTDATPILELVGDTENMIISYNFCDHPFVYNNMTAETDKHVDNQNRSMALTPYPTALYAAHKDIDDAHPLTMSGLLPAGTVIELYLEQGFGGSIYIEADGVLLHEEKMDEQMFTVDVPLSQWHRFAPSDKCIRLTLAQDTEALRFYARGGGAAWSGMELSLPEKYATERWFHATDHDVYLGLQEEAGVYLQRSASIRIDPEYRPDCTHIEIHEDLTYTTASPWAESNRETIRAWCEAVAALEGNCAIRIERASFSGVRWADMAAYYTDMLELFNEYGFSWWTNDYWVMTDEYPQTRIVAESPQEPYAGFPVFNKELLELLQAHSY